MTLDELLDRTYAATGKGTVYALGSGAPAHSPVPAGEDGACDCSGFVAWAFAYPRYQPYFSWLKRINGGWMNTDGIVEDVQHVTGLWEQDPDRNVGSVLVYPSRAYAVAQSWKGTWGAPKIGHVGIITRRVASGWRIVHCSQGNFLRWNDAVRETGTEVFDKVPYTLCARFAGLEAA